MKKVYLSIEDLIKNNLNPKLLKSLTLSGNS